MSSGIRSTGTRRYSGGRVEQQLIDRILSREPGRETRDVNAKPASDGSPHGSFTTSLAPAGTFSSFWVRPSGQRMSIASIRAASPSPNVSVFSDADR